MTEVTKVRSQYLEEGYDCIPLKPLTKEPLSPGWPNRAPFRQWQHAEKNSNFGLRAGNGKAFIDCDNKTDPETFANVTHWLEGLGHKPGSYPVIQTASGIGRHIYVNFAGALIGHWRSLAVGSGEFRYGKGSMVAAPPSIVETGIYKILEGDTAHLPTLDNHDIATLIKNYEVATNNPNPKMSALAQALKMGQGKERYQSDSEAEAALVLSLINSGFDFQQIKDIFDTSPCAGKYAEIRTRNAKRAEAYIRHTYNNARDYSQNESPTRRAIREIQEMAEGAAWGRATDKLVFLAHAQIAYKAGRFEYAASRRDLALEAGLASDKSATNATNRLMEKNLLKLEEKGTAIFANKYFLQVDKITHFLTSKFLGSGYKCPLFSQVVENGHILDLEGLETSNAFRNGKGRLGRRAGQVYKLLFLESLTASEIAKRTGASLKTIRRTLAKLASVKDYKAGEIIEMVSRDGKKWHSNMVDLDIIEAIYGTRGAREKQRIDYEIERREHTRRLEIGTLCKEKYSSS